MIREAPKEWKTVSKLEWTKATGIVEKLREECSYVAVGGANTGHLRMPSVA